LYRWSRLVLRARRLAATAARADDPGEWFDLLDRFPDFRPLQRRIEIVGLMERLAALRPARLLEIGSWHGGTAFLFGRVATPEATLVLVDTGFDLALRSALPRLLRRGQRMICLRADTHLAATRDRIRELVHGEAFDFLFIDGDHSYEGVAADFRDYAPLVRAGGLIAFHDVVMDHRTRRGADTVSSSGGVWRFWAEVRRSYGAATAEYIEDPGQDGAGIGVLRWDGVFMAPTDSAR
jgi:cephalosporin hydroxylase